MMVFSSILPMWTVVVCQKGFYPAHLTWEWGVKNSLRRIVFLGLQVVDPLELVYYTNLKPTNSAIYISWESNTPGAVKLN